MSLVIKSSEYPYTATSGGHHHAYLVAPLFKLLSLTPSINQQKLKVLDLGCGNGSLSRQIAQAGYEVTGVEDSASGVQLAVQHVPECDFVHASIYDLPYSRLENKFDVVLAVEVIEHLFAPRELLRAAKRCLKPGGQLIITTPYHGYLKNLLLAISGKTDQHFTALWDGGHIKFFSVTTLSQLLTEEGFHPVQFRFAGRLPYLWKSMLCSSVVTV